MLKYVIFWTDVSNFRKVRQLLVDEFNLVLPDIKRQTPRIAECHLENYLVYEDPKIATDERPGIYRVNFKSEYEFEFGSHIGFRYWDLRLNDTIRDVDPMKDALKVTYDLLKPATVTDWAVQEINIESLLSP